MPKALSSPSPGGSGAGSHQSIQKRSIWEPACPSDGLTAPRAQDTDESCHRSDKTLRDFPIPLAPGRPQQEAGGSQRLKEATTRAPTPFPVIQQSWKHKRAPPGRAAGHSHAFPCRGGTRATGCRGLVVPHEPHAGATPAPWLAPSCRH